MLNYIWIGFFVLSATAALYQTLQGNAAVFTDMMAATFSMSRTGFEIALGLTGVLTFWMGIMKIGEEGGVVRLLSRLVAPIEIRMWISMGALKCSGMRLAVKVFCRAMARLVTGKAKIPKFSVGGRMAVMVRMEQITQVSSDMALKTPKSRPSSVTMC